MSSPTRRSVLQMLLAAQAAGLAACRKEPRGSKKTPPDPTDPTPTDTGDPPTTDTEPTDPPPPPDPFEALERVRRAARASPDHLAEEARRRIAVGDPQQILDFVRDGIGTVLASWNAWGPPERRVAGARGALRSGAGSLFDRAELLAWMYTEAGYSAVVRFGTPALSGQALVDALSREPEYRFEPGIDEVELEELRASFGLGPAAEIPVVDADGAESGALAAEVLASLPPGLDAVLGNTPLNADLGAWPVVEVDFGAGPVVANPHLPGALVGDTGCVGALWDGAPHDDEPIVFEILTRTVYPWGFPTSVCRLEAPQATLVGRHVRVAFVPPTPAEVWLGAPIQQSTTLVPYLSIEGPDLTDDEVLANTVEGTAFDLAGVTYAVVDGQAVVDGFALPAGTTDPALLAGITSISVTASAGTFPTVALRVAVRGAAGAIQGLFADAFGVRDEGEGVAAQLLRAEPPERKILLVFDRSGSIPPEFRDAEAAALAELLATEVLALAPGVQFAAASIDTGLSGGSEWTADPAALAAQVLALTAEDDALWGAVDAAAGTGAAVVVLVTDGHSADGPNEQLLARLRFGPPVLSLAVGPDPNEEVLDALSAATAGRWAPVADAADVVDEVVADLDDALEAFYVLQYVAPAATPTTRVAEVVVGSASGDTTYEVPAAAQPARRLREVVLRIARGGRESFVRLGVDPSEDGSEQEALHLSLFATRLVAVELGSPTPSRIVDDLASAVISKRRLWDAAQPGSTDSALEAMTSAYRQAPREALFALAPTGTLPLAPRIAMYSLVPVPDGIVEELCHIPLSRGRAPVTDPRGGFEESVRRSAQQAVLQAGLYRDTAYAELAGRPLVWFECCWPPGWDGETIARWDERKARAPYWWFGAPEDGRGDAWWLLDPETGTLLPQREPGSGAPLPVTWRDQEPAEVTRANHMFAWGSLAGGLLGGGLGLGVLLAVHKGVVALVIKSTIAIQTMDGGGIDVDDAAKAILKDIVKEFVLGAWPEGSWAKELGEKISLGDTLVEIATGKGVIDRVT